MQKYMAIFIFCLRNIHSAMKWLHMRSETIRVLEVNATKLFQVLNLGKRVRGSFKLLLKV